LDFEPPPYTPEFADSPLPPPKSSPMGAIGIGVLALALMALAWWVRPTGSLIPSSGHPSDVLQGAAIVAAPTDAGDAGAGADGSILAPPPSTDLDAGLSNEADAGEAGKERLDIVSVHIDSTPPGATVLVNRQAFGTTPINLRFKTELTYDLLFQLDGYPSLEKRVYISKRKGQTIQVDLERKKRFWLF
jgi:hypothetical protein